MWCIDSNHSNNKKKKSISEISNYIKSKPINKDQAERKMCPFPGIELFISIFTTLHKISGFQEQNIKDVKEQENKHDQEHRG